MDETCIHWEYEDYYDTNCGHQIDYEHYEAIEPDFCPYCGGKIESER